jgi:pimeloyl-ACP methyl ester carboxylesterase
MIMDSDQTPIRLFEEEGVSIAYRLRAGAAPTLVFLPGYMSDMEGAKAQALHTFAEGQGLACLRFDYSGTGSSPGGFEQGTLDRWLADSLAAVDRLTQGPLILVGSSMGGWLALHVALQRSQRVQGIVGIAAAPDFTDWGFSEADRERLRSEGKIEEREQEQARGRYFTRTFWESGQTMLLLHQEIAVDCPVRLIHGTLDADVPAEVAHRTVQQLRSADVQLTLIKGGGHRLSEPHEIDAVLRATAELVERCR